MKKYRHREDGFEITAEYSKAYNLSRYLIHGGYPATELAFYLTAKDFEGLFEPAPEYCCNWFRKCVQRGIFKRVGEFDHIWMWIDLGETFEECPFCKRKLE